MLTLEEIESKLFVLKHYDDVFSGEKVRQKFPTCCGQMLEFGELLKADVKAAKIEIEGTFFTMFEVICPICGQTIPPQWDVWL